jgi:hypothetical protein
MLAIDGLNSARSKRFTRFVIARWQGAGTFTSAARVHTAPLM